MPAHAGMFFIGVGSFDFSALNRRLRANGYESIDAGLTGWGLAEGGDATFGPGRGLTGVYRALAIGFGGGPVADRR